MTLLLFLCSVKLQNIIIMLLNIKRYLSNARETLANLFGDNYKAEICIAEHTVDMLATGIYQVTLLPVEDHKPVIAVVASDNERSETSPYVLATFEVGMPLKRGTILLDCMDYDRLFRTVSRCYDRGERIDLFISDHMMVRYV